MNWLLFADVLAVVVFLWVFFGIAYGWYILVTKPYATVTFAGWSIVALVVSLSYGLARFFG